jgi:hypothetical protein
MKPTACSTWVSSMRSSACDQDAAAQRQNLMFSATYSDDIRTRWPRACCAIRSASRCLRNKTADKVEQVAYRVPKEHKRHLLAHLIKEGNWHQVLVFTRTKHGANRLAEQLRRGHRRRCDPRQQEPERARARARGFQEQSHHRAGRDRSRLARPRHQGTAARRQLRAAERAGRLRAPHRPHRT